ncbi:MAG: hypothetical protein J07HQX50_00014, partial [Haloquadratum sp. J07HQX50]
MRLRRVAFRRQFHVYSFRFRLVIQKRRKAVERPPVQVETAMVASVSGLVVLVVFSDAAEVVHDNRSNTSFDTLLYDCFREYVQEVCLTTLRLRS